MAKTLSYIFRATCLLLIGGAVEAQDKSLAGFMSGQAQVSASGSLRYELPISLPPAVGGFGPSLSIRYRSGSQDSTELMGIGWGLGGLSTITRCPQTKAQDTQFKAVSFSSNDRFCLNGQRLVAVSGVYGQSGTEYRTEIDSFIKVISYDTAGNGPSYFKVWTKDGLVQEFGNSADSKLYANLGAQALIDPVTFTSSAPLASTVQAWGLNKVSDRSNNYWKVTYDAVNNKAGVLYPLTIGYSANGAGSPNNRVEIIYEDRSLFDKAFQFQIGSLISPNRRIKTIKTFAGLLQQAAEYRFSYQETTGAYTPANHSRLSSIEECHVDNLQEFNCLDKTLIDWSSTEALAGWPGLSTYQGQSPLPILTPQTRVVTNLNGWGAEYFYPQSADITGDGRSDVVHYAYSLGQLKIATLLAKSGTANSAFDSGPPLQTLSLTNYTSELYPAVTLADVDRDGKADLVAAFMGGEFKIYVFKAIGGGYFGGAQTFSFTATPALTSEHRLLVNDANGDGVLDFIAIGGKASCDGAVSCGGTSRSASGDVRVALRNAAGTATGMSLQTTTLDLSAWPNSNIYDFTVGDIDGDGIPDALLSSQIASSSSANGQWYNPSTQTFQNGIGYPATGDYGVYVAKGNGTGGFGSVTAGIAVNASALAASPSICGSTPDFAGYMPNLLDVNRDGLVDVLLDQVVACYTTQTTARAVVAITTAVSRGDGSFAVREGRAQYALEKDLPVSIPGWVPLYLDIDGNGTLDVLHLAPDGEGKIWGLSTVGMGTGVFSAATINFQVSNAFTGWGTSLYDFADVLAADANADGVADATVTFLSSQGYSNALVLRAASDTSLTAVELQNQVAAVTRGHIKDEFDYAALPSNMAESSPIYTKDSDATYPKIDLNAPFFVVTQTRLKLNGSLQSKTDYRYTGAKADLEGRGFLGFRKVKATTTTLATLPTSGVQTLTREIETTYRQDFPYTGMPVLTTQKANAILVSKTESNPSTDFAVVRQFGTAVNVHFPQIKKTLTTNYDPLNGTTVLNSTEINRLYTAYGSVDEETSITRNAGQTESFTTFTDNTYFAADESVWKVDLLQKREVTSSRTGVANPITTTISFDYDSVGRLSQEVVEPGTPALRAQKDYQRDPYGNVTFITTSGPGDPLYAYTAIEPRTTEMRYEAGPGYPAGVFNTAVITPVTPTVSHTISRTFDPLTGALATENDVNNLTTTYGFDALGRATSQIRAGAAKVTILREKCGSSVPAFSGSASCEPGEYLRITTTQAVPAGTTPTQCEVAATIPTTVGTSYVFVDGLGREVRKATLAFNGTNYSNIWTQYDEAGRVKRISKPALNGGTLYWTNFEYDPVGRTTKQVLPGARTTETTYSGLITTIKDPNLQLRTETRNAAGELIQVKDAANQLLTYQLDASGRVIKTIDPKNNEVGFTLDKLGRKTEQRDPDLGTWNYRYNGLGELVWQKDAAGKETYFTYDKLGRPLTRSEFDLVSTWTWDMAANGIGKLAKLESDHDFERTYAYNGFGYLSSTTTKKTIDPNAIVGDPDFVSSTCYDSAGRPRIITSPSGKGYKNIYNSGGYLSQVVDKDTDAVLWTANARDAEGRVIRQTLGNGLVTDRKYKVDTGYLESIQTGTLSGTTLTANVQNDTYGFDNIGNLLNRSHYFDSISISETFTYDPLNRLTIVTPVGGAEKRATYDEIGNITSRSDIGAYSYVASANCTGVHKVCGLNGAVNSSFTYDANGNLTAGNGRSITWFSYNYPKVITQGTSTETFQYSPERERVSRISVENGQATTTVYLSPRIDLGGTFEKTYKPNGDVDRTHYFYADGQAIGSYTSTSASGSTLPTGPIWSTTFDAAPTTTNPNPQGMYIVDTSGLNLIAWDAAGKVGFNAKLQSQAFGATADLISQRAYAAAESVLTRFEVTPATCATEAYGYGRFLWARLEGGSSTAGVLFEYDNITALGQTMTASPGVTYVVEILTGTTTNTIRVYPKGQLPSTGIEASEASSWGGTARKLMMMARAEDAFFGEPDTDCITYVDDVSEEAVEATPKVRYFHFDHLGSVTALTDEFRFVKERFSYDAWGKRRFPSGGDDNQTTTVWSTSLSTAPTTSNPNSTGVTMPSTNPLTLITWGSGRLGFANKNSATVYLPGVQGQRLYLNENVTFRGEITLAANVGANGRYFLFGVGNGGTTAAGSGLTGRYHRLYLRGNTVYASTMDGTVSGGNLTVANTNLNYPQTLVAGNTYVVEVETTGTTSTLYFYLKTQSRAQGVKHIARIDWGSSSGLKRRLEAYAYAASTETTGNITYLDNLSEASTVPLNTIKSVTTDRGYTLHEHLDSVSLVHMNGRVYDPLVGRFISADPNVFYPGELQDFNRYSYVHNNPLSFFDPDGFEIKEADLSYSVSVDSSLEGAFLRNIAKLVNVGLTNTSTGQFNWFGPNGSDGMGTSDSPSYMNGGAVLGTVLVGSHVQLSWLSNRLRNSGKADPSAHEDGGFLNYYEGADGIPLFHPSMSGFHQYFHVNSCSKTIAECTAANAFQGLLRYPAPGFSWYGVPDPIEDEQVSWVPPFGKVRHEVFLEDKMIMNITAGSHLMEPGKVARWIGEDENYVYIRTYGDGTGALGTVNEDPDIVDKVWGGINEDIFKWMGVESRDIR